MYLLKDTKVKVYRLIRNDTNAFFSSLIKPYKELKRLGVEPDFSDYEFVTELELNTNTPKRVMYLIMESEELPDDYIPSVSDVFEVENKFYYIDPDGVCELPREFRFPY